MKNEIKYIYNAVCDGARITQEDARTLLASDDLLAIGRIADARRRAMNGTATYYIKNRHINYTNVCRNGCTFCAYQRPTAQDEGAFTLSLDEIVEKANEGKNANVSEFHIVGGLNDDIPFSYYTDMLSALKTIAPTIHIQAFTCVELDYIAKRAGLPLRDALRALRDAGLDSVPGGGAEIFDEELRKRICEKKISGERWLHVARTLHEQGIHSNATMLFGHVESHEHIVDHLSRLRALQDQTKGFLSFIPLAFHPQNTTYEKTISPPTGVEMLRMLAVSRIFLDNVPHIKAFWIMLGVKLAQVSQFFGVDDIDGTVTEEKITHAAGAKTPEALTERELRSMIESAGFTPIERDTLYTPR